MQANHDLANRVMAVTHTTLWNLKDRWQDESKYENINDYVNVLKQLVNTIEGVQFISFSKRPWGFIWEGSDGGRRQTKIQGNKVITLRLAR